VASLTKRSTSLETDALNAESMAMPPASVPRERATSSPSRPADTQEEGKPASLGTVTAVGLADALRQSVERARRGPSALDEALASLRELAAGNGGAPDALETARLLKRAALERKHSAPRTASVALVVADALTFTNVAVLAQAARQPLTLALQTLVKPFISTENEREVMRSFLANRWYVTPAFDAAVLEQEGDPPEPQRA
jgi:hypothetical protein